MSDTEREAPVTDEDVRAAWIAWSDPGDERWTPERFDRWLREHDAAVWDAAKAAVERIHPRCTEECEMCAEMDDWLHTLDDANPYRSGS